MQDQITHHVLLPPSLNVPKSVLKDGNAASPNSPSRLTSIQHQSQQPNVGQQALVTTQGPTMAVTTQHGPTNLEQRYQESFQPMRAAIRPQMQPPSRNPESLPGMNLPGFSSQRPPRFGSTEETAITNPQAASQGLFCEPQNRASRLGLDDGCEASLNAGQIAGCQANSNRHRGSAPNANEHRIPDPAAAEQAVQTPDLSHYVRTEAGRQASVRGRSPARIEAVPKAQSCQQEYASTTPVAQDLQENDDARRQPSKQNQAQKSALVRATLSPSASNEREPDPTQSSKGNSHINWKYK